MNYIFKKIKLTLAGIFIILLLTSGMLVAPRTAHATMPTFDAATFTRTMIENAISGAMKALTNKMILKEYVFDAGAWVFSKKHLKELTYATLKDVATGHTNKNGTKGAGFVTNLKKYTLKVGDRVASSSIHAMQKNRPSGTQLTAYAKSLATSAGKSVKAEYYKSTSQKGFWSTHKETLSDNVASTSSFLSGDFGMGGWNGFNSIDSNTNNNPYSVSQSAKDSTNKKIAAAKANKKSELNWGQGFLSKTKCDGDNCSIKTPGSVIKGQVGKVLGSGVDSLVTSDEISEVIGAFAEKLATNIVGSGGGLTGVAKAGVSGGASMLSKYLTEPPPPKAVKNMTSTIKGQIKQKEAPVSTYISNEQKIATAANDATANLQKLIKYNIDYTDSSGKQRSCSTPSPTIAAAKGALTKVQQTVSAPTKQSITNAQQGLTKLKKIDTEVSSASVDGIEKITNEFEQLTGPNGGLPTLEQMLTAKTESSATPKGPTIAGHVKSSGVAGLTVTGGTTVGRMNLLNRNATSALNEVQQTCANQKQQDQDTSNF